MKKGVVSLLIAVSVLGFLVAPAVAQTVHNSVVQVPFDFVANNRAYAAGSYLLTKGGTFVALRDGDGRFLTYLGSHPAQSQELAPKTRLVFYEVDGKHFLARIWFAGSGEGVELIRAGKETEVAQQFSATETRRTANVIPQNSGK
jgi:hypothetical protein